MEKKMSGPKIYEAKPFQTLGNFMMNSNFDLVGDFDEAETQEAVRVRLGGHVDLVLSDMGASTTGHAATDHLRSAALAEAAFEFATEVLADDGAMVVKLLQGAEVLCQKSRRSKI